MAISAGPVIAKFLGFLKRLLPAGAFSRLWAVRHAVGIGITLSVGAVWMICGLLFDEPPAVLTGWLMVSPVGLWSGYRAGKGLQDRRAARAAAAAPPPPPAGETPAN